MKSLAMMKLEKNFTAVISKGYPRKPYEYYPVKKTNRESMSLIAFVRREMIELEQAINILDQNNPTAKAIRYAKLEVADVSNTLDYLFEGLSGLEV